VKVRKTVKRNRLAKRELAIGERLKRVRKMLRLSQGEFSKQVGITRPRLAICEELRAPLGFELGLRICRQFILSEKWLATGAGDMRQCLDLNSRGESHQLAIDTPYGQAYDRLLGAIYEQARGELGDAIDLDFHETDSFEFLRNYFDYLLDRWADKLPKRQKLPAGYRQMLCAALIGTGRDFVDLSARMDRCPTPEELLKFRVQAGREVRAREPANRRR
jgi:hypothetical protein